MQWVLSLHLHMAPELHSDCKMYIERTFICWAVSPVPKKNFIGIMVLDFEAWKEPERPSHVLRNITGWYNRKIQLLHCCIQSWGLSTPETFCMKGRMALLWLSSLLISFWTQWAKIAQIQFPSVPLQSYTHQSQDLQKFHPEQLQFKAILLIGSRTPNFTTGLNTGDGRVYSTLWPIHSPSVCLWN